MDLATEHVGLYRRATRTLSNHVGRAPRPLVARRPIHGVAVRDGDWRTNIDAASEDPREEIAFHNGLQQLARIIDQTPGGGRRFKATGMSVDWGKRGI